MFQALAQYIKDEATPRWRTIVLTWESVIALSVFIFFLKFGNRLFNAHPKVSDVSTGVIAYASIALGFCIAGLTISLTFPEPKFTLKLATPPHKGQKTNPYSDLLFVFSWTAIAHWLAVLVMFLVVLLTDGGLPLIPEGYPSFASKVGSTSFLARFRVGVLSLRLHR